MVYRLTNLLKSDKRESYLTLTELQFSNTSQKDQIPFDIYKRNCQQKVLNYGKLSIGIKLSNNERGSVKGAASDRLTG